MTDQHILLLKPLPPEAVEWLTSRGATVHVADSEGDWKKHAPVIRGLVFYSGNVDKGLLDELPVLEVVAKRGVGVETIDFAETRRRGIKVTSLRGAENSNAVAEHAITLLMAANRSLIIHDRVVKSGHFQARSSLPLSGELAEMRIGIVGAGNIGSRIGRMLVGGFGATVGYYDPYLAAGTELPGSLFPTVEDLAQWSDALVIAAPLTDDTRGLVNETALRLLGAQGLLVNASRGGIVDESALSEALRAGTIRGAGVDVFASEPDPPAPDHPFFALDNVVLTPHAAAATQSARMRSSMAIAEQVWELMNGRTAPTVDDPAWSADTLSARSRG